MRLNMDANTQLYMDEVVNGLLAHISIYLLLGFIFWIMVSIVLRKYHIIQKTSHFKYETNVQKKLN